MAIYQKPLDLWCENTTRGILSGAVKIQPGQWVKCGGGPLSRYVSHDPAAGTFNVVHGGGKDAADLFRRRINAVKMAVLRDKSRFEK